MVFYDVWAVILMIGGLLVTKQHARPVSIQEEEKDWWKGRGHARVGPCSRELWEKYDGFCSPEERQAKVEMYAQLRQKLAEKLGVTEELPNDGLLHIADYQFDLTQATQLLSSLKHEESRRLRRKILADFNTKKWNSTIYYILDGSIGGKYNKQVVRDGIALWEENTCLRFIEAEEEQDDVIKKEVEQYLVFGMFGSKFGCSSFLGRTTQQVPQPIFLNDRCLRGAVVTHEIGHALGVIHEHQRRDRDDYISIHLDNVYTGFSDYFATYQPDVTTALGVPYDYASVMHYHGRAMSHNDKDTITTVDPAYQQTIGQRVELSFLDVQLVNRVYCDGRCIGEDTVSCYHSGYPDPRDCSRCICPDGWAGPRCNELQAPKGASCGGRVTASSSPSNLSSPGYTEKEKYEEFQQCTWLITASANQRISLRFTGAFRIHEEEGVCHHWVEIKTETDRYELAGPRFCGKTRPGETIVSRGNEVLVLFRAKSDRSYRTERTGFNLEYTAVGEESPVVTNPCESSPCARNEQCLVADESYECICQSNCSTCHNVPFTAHLGNNLHLVIGLDSLYHSRKPYSAITSFFQSLICSIDKNKERARQTHAYALVTYVAQPVYHSRLTADISSITDVMTQEFHTRHGTTNIFTAIEGITQHYFSSHRSNTQAHNIIVLYLDSPFQQSSRLSDDIAGARQVLRDNQLELIVVTVGLTPQDVSTTKDIAGQWNVVDISSYDILTEQSHINRKVRAVIHRIQQISNRPLPAPVPSTTRTTTGTVSTTSNNVSIAMTTASTPSTTTTTLPTTIELSRPQPSRPRREPTTSTPITTSPTTTRITTSATTTRITTWPTTTRITTSSTTTTEVILPTEDPVETDSRYNDCFETETPCSQCGGCGVRTIKTWCYNQRGEAERKAEREEECTEACVVNCPIWIGRLYHRVCKLCCTRAVKVGDECILEEHLHRYR